MLEEASVYKAIWESSNGNKGPRDVDDMYIWEIAVLLGHAKELETSQSKPKRGSVPPGFSEAAIERNRQRVLAKRGLAPKPEAKPVSFDQLNQMGAALNGR